MGKRKRKKKKNEPEETKDDRRLTYKRKRGRVDDRKK